jgi:hypothetical protein
MAQLRQPLFFSIFADFMQPKLKSRVSARGLFKPLILKADSEKVPFIHNLPKPLIIKADLELYPKSPFFEKSFRGPHFFAFFWPVF